MSTSVPWSEQEVEVLRTLRPYIRTRKLVLIFTALGFDRSAKAITHKAQDMQVYFGEEGIPDLSKLDKEDAEIIQNVLGYKDIVEPPLTPVQNFAYPITTADKTRAALFIEELMEYTAENNITKQLPDIPAVSDKLSACLLLSDWHLGKLELDDDGQPSYNLTIAQQRVQNMMQQLLKTIKHHYDNQVDEIVVCIMGDMADGKDVFPGQEERLEMFPINQIEECVRVLWHDVILKLSNYFPKVRIVTIAGNHGAGKGSKNSITNWDNIIYSTLDALIQSSKIYNKVTIKNAFHKERNMTTIKTWKFLITHKGPKQVETAAGKTQAAGRHEIHDYDCWCYGHYHHFSNGTWNSKQVFVNGTLVGGDDYAEGLGLRDNAEQTLIMVSIDKCVYAVHQLVVEI